MGGHHRAELDDRDRAAKEGRDQLDDPGRPARRSLPPRRPARRHRRRALLAGDRHGAGTQRRGARPRRERPARRRDARGCAGLRDGHRPAPAACSRRRPPRRHGVGDQRVGHGPLPRRDDLRRSGAAARPRRLAGARSGRLDRRGPPAGHRTRAAACPRTSWSPSPARSG